MHVLIGTKVDGRCVWNIAFWTVCLCWFIQLCQKYFPYIPELFNSLITRPFWKIKTFLAHGDLKLLLNEKIFLAFHIFCVFIKRKRLSAILNIALIVNSILNIKVYRLVHKERRRFAKISEKIIDAIILLNYGLEIVCITGFVIKLY